MTSEAEKIDFTEMERRALLHLGVPTSGGRVSKSIATFARMYGGGRVSGKPIEQRVQTDLGAILRTEWDEEFVRRMRERMIVSYYKYGPLRDAYPERVSAIASLTDRLRKYAETGNTEFLVDAANFALIEYLAPSHPDAHFRATDSDESPGRRAARTGMVDERNNEEVGTGRAPPSGSSTRRFR